MASLARASFESHVKELLWHKDKWENNFQKASTFAVTSDDFDTLRTNISRMRTVLDTCDGIIFDSGQVWDQGSLRKCSIKSSMDSAVNGLSNGGSILLASNSSSERSSNGSPFNFSSQGDIMGTSGGGFSNSSMMSDLYDRSSYDPLASVSELLTESTLDHGFGSSSSTFPDNSSINGSASSVFSSGGFVGTPHTPQSSYWPSSSSSSWPASTSSPGMTNSDLFTAFATSPKPSFAAIAQLPPAPEALLQNATARKNSDAAASSPTTNPAIFRHGSISISETPLTVNQQKPHLAKIIYVFPLNYKMDESVLERYFSQFGKVSKTRIFRYPNGASKTAGIVDFDDASSAVSAIKKKYHHVDGCQIEAKQFEPKSHEFASMVSSHGLVSRSSHFVNNTEYQVFIGGIPSNATDEDIEKSITVFGRVKRIQVNPNGTFAFVSFASEAEAMKICTARSINICGKLVECKKNEPIPSQRVRTNTSESSATMTTSGSNGSVAGSACQNCKKAKVKAVLTCDHRVECFECVKAQKVCPKCGNKLDLTKEPAKKL